MLRPLRLKPPQVLKEALNTAMEKLSSGSRINYAKDDAAGQAIATRITAEVQVLKMASRNASDAQGLIDTAEGALQESHNLLLRMRELAVQSANGTMSGDDRSAIDAELGQLIEEVERVAQTRSWAGNSLINGQRLLTVTNHFHFRLVLMVLQCRSSYCYH